MSDFNTSRFSLLVWKPEYESGHPVIDRQHRQLFSEVNTLLSVMLDNKPKNDIAHLIEHLLESARRHFADEEAILDSTRYRGTAEHTLIHRQLLQKGKRLADRFDENRLDFNEMFSYLANDIVLEHILKTDKQYFDLLELRDR